MMTDENFQSNMSHKMKELLQIQAGW